MRYMALWHPASNKQKEAAAGCVTPNFAEMGKLIEEMTKAGVLVDTGGWDPASPSTIIKRSGDKVTVTDGPYAEAKEVIAGFAVLEVKSKEEALEWSTRFIKIAGEGFSELR